MNITEAWVLHEGPKEEKVRAELHLEPFQFPDIGDHEVLIEPLFGAWEGNYGHAVARSPIDICRARGEKAVVLGNCGVVRVLKPGSAVRKVREGEICILMGNAVPDPFGYMIRAHAYDAPNTVGVLAKRTKAHERQLIHIPAGNKFTLQQWAAFSLRYIAAWANWRVAYGCWRLQVPEHFVKNNFAVWGWGGGTAFAELGLAKLAGAQSALIASKVHRLQMAEQMGFLAIDRRNFSGLQFDEDRYESEPEYREHYKRSETAFLEKVKVQTDGKGVAIFIDNIGEPVFRVTTKALAREGVIATAGWKCGMKLTYLRASECIARHTFVHTHYASYQEAEDAVRFANVNGWLPPTEVLHEVYRWENIGRLASEYASEQTESYFPLFEVNKL